MKNIIYFSFFLSLFSSTLFSQNSDVNQGCVPFEVNFTAPPGGSSFFWDFGNGTTSTLENPASTFTSAGVYDVALYDQPGGTLVGTVSISAFDPPVLEIFASPANSGCSPFSVEFSYSSNLPPGINVIQQQWVFGDGGSESTTAATVNHTFLSGGTYFVSLEIVTDAPSCNKTQIFDDFIIVQDAPDSGILTSPSPAQSCTAPFDVTFEAAWAGASSYSWNFGNGATSNQQNPPTQTYQEGNYTATLTVTDNLGCSSTSQQIVSVGSPVATINLPDTVCIDEPYEVGPGNPPAFYIWNFGPNAAPSISGIAEPEVTFSTEGTQTVSLTITSLDLACSSTITKDIYVEEAVATFTTEPSFHCANPLITTAIADANNGNLYNWTFYYEGVPFAVNSGQTVTQELDDPSEFYPYSEDPMNFFQTSLFVVTNAGCEAEANNFYGEHDTIALYKANFFETDINGCAPLEVTLTDSSTNKTDIILWEWFVDDTLIASNTAPDPIDYTFWTPGTYEIFLVVTTNNPECPGDTSAVHTYTVGLPYDLSNIESELECTAASPIELCPKDSIPISLPSGGLVLDGINLSNSVDDVIISDETLYIVDNGCVSQKDLDLSLICDPITVLNGPEAVIECESSCETPFVINVSAVNSLNTNSYLWDFGDGTTSTDPTVEHTYSSTGDYQMTLTAFNSSVNCPPSVKTLTVYIREIHAEMEPISVICSMDTVTLRFDASSSEDVHETCSTGYNWDYAYDDLPPFHTGDSVFYQSFPSGTFDSLILVVNDINGCKDTTGIPFGVYGAELAIGIDDNRICNDQEVVFTNLSTVDTTIASILWDFGDGTNSTEENPVHNYTNPPPNNSFYPIQLTISDDLGCTYIERDTIEYYNLDAFILSDPIACQGQVYSPYASDYTVEGSFLNYEWDFGNGTTGTGQTPEVIYDELGFYTISLTYTEESSGCSRTESVSVEVVSFPDASFVSDNDNSAVLCAPANVFFTNTSDAASTATYFWDFGNGQTSIFEDPATVFEAGEYTVTLIVSNQAGCQDTTTRTYTVLDPQGGFTVDKTTICKGEEITFQLLDTSDVGSFVWDFGDGVTIADMNPVTHTYNFHPPSGTTVATLILYSDGGFCPFSVDTAIFIQEVIADFQRNDGIDTAICLAPYPFTNLSQNADSYEWDFGDGTTSTEVNPVHEYSQPGTYDVSLYIENDALGCNDEIIYTVVVFPYPNPQVLGDTICLGEEAEVIIEAYEPSSIYTWSPMDLVDTITGSTMFTSPSNSVTFTLSEETETGCIGEGTADVLVILPPAASTGFDTTVVMGTVLTLPVNYEDYLIFNWNPEEGLSCTDCSNPTVGPITEEAAYDLNITDIYGCIAVDLSYTIAVHPETFINMPTTFTPNGDNTNDEIPVFGWGIKELKYYQIFNRWGEKVFETTDLNEGWDGTHNGVEQNSDVYAFKILALDWKDEEIVEEGFINLVR